MSARQRRTAAPLRLVFALALLVAAPQVAQTSAAPAASERPAPRPGSVPKAAPGAFPGPPPDAVVHDGHQLSEVIPLFSRAGPPLVVQIADNISWVDIAAPRPVVIARNLTLRGVGAAEATELNLHGQYDAWRVAPGAYLQLQNLTLSNLAVRPPSGQPPPPANVSVFTFPIWFINSDR